MVEAYETCRVECASMGDFSQESELNGDGVSHRDEKPMSAEDAFQQYTLGFGKFGEAEEIPGLRRNAFPWGKSTEHSKDSQRRIEPDVKAAFEMHMMAATAVETQLSQKGKDFPGDDNVDEDSDGEQLLLCRKCDLPLGDVRYSDGDGCNVHGECMAHILLARASEEGARTREDHLRENEERRNGFGIGWKADCIPRNEACASRLALRSVPNGLVCLLLDEAAHSIRLAATLEPAAAVNLEYLSIALKVRRKEGHEPIFSLEPSNNEKRSKLRKVFAPDWLATTSAGEVLFQADYHLKELCMGEHEQPVVGMISSFDLAEMELRTGDWSAREWFLVRQAEMQITDDKALIPFVKMGVEAREQVCNSRGYEDLPITRKDHPMVKYAETFTRYFDLIAERKSVIYHLRELAKSSVLAKYLLDLGVSLEESMFNLASESVSDVPSSLEVPQLWHEKQHSRLQVGDRAIEDDNVGNGSHIHSVYGGVNFGLDKFSFTKGLAGPFGTLRPRIGAASLVTSAATLAPRAIAPRATTLSIAGPPASKVAAKAMVQEAMQQAMPAIGRMSRLVGKGPSDAMVARFRGVDFKVPGIDSRSFGAVKPDAIYQTNGSVPGFRSFAVPGMAPPSALSLSAVGAPRLMQPPIAHGIAPVPRVPPVDVVSKYGKPLALDLQVLGAGVPANPSLRGVDLRLDNFDLSSAKRVSSESQSGGAVKPLDECVAIGDAFWSSLQGSAGNDFEEDDLCLLNAVFNPALSDRRSEGDRFCPPTSSRSYVSKLRALVDEEESIRMQRKEQFFNTNFVMSEPGSIFPASWTSALSAVRDGVPVRSLSACPRGALIARPEYVEYATDLLNSTLKTSAPVFDRITEEGMRFRIYRLGSLEVRTSQDWNDAEVVGAVFFISAEFSGDDKATDESQDAEECLAPREKITRATEFVEKTSVAGGRASAQRRHYVVVETEHGHTILTERLPDGKVCWKVNPPNLKDRISLSKVMRASPGPPGTVVEDLKSYHRSVARGACLAGIASPSTCKHFARSAFARVVPSLSKARNV